MEHVSISLTII